MSDLADLVARASTYGLLLSAHPDGRHLRATSVTHAPVPDAFRAELLAAKPELLAHLARRDQALDIVCAMMSRLADCYPIGCPTESPEWRQADAAITKAYWSGDLAELRRTVAHYERFALRSFELYRTSLERREAG